MASHSRRLHSLGKGAAGFSVLVPLNPDDADFALLPRTVE